jgi:hypothetical protein
MAAAAFRRLGLVRRRQSACFVTSWFGRPRIEFVRPHIPDIQTSHAKRTRLPASFIGHLELLDEMTLWETNGFGTVPAALFRMGFYWSPTLSLTARVGRRLQYDLGGVAWGMEKEAIVSMLLFPSVVQAVAGIPWTSTHNVPHTSARGKVL